MRPETPDPGVPDTRAAAAPQRTPVEPWVPALRQGIRVQRIGGESVLLDLAGERVHQLNAVGTFILDRCDGTRTVDDIVAAVVAHHDVAEDVAARHAAELLERMKALDILT